MTNDAWFRNSAEPYQHLQASIFRAVENRVNVVRSANTGVSCSISPGGRISGRVADNLGRDVEVAGVAATIVETVPWRSFYTRFGDLFAWLCICLFSVRRLVASLSFLAARRRKRR